MCFLWRTRKCCTIKYRWKWAFHPSSYLSKLELLNCIFSYFATVKMTFLLMGIQIELSVDDDGNRQKMLLLQSWSDLFATHLDDTLLHISRPSRHCIIYHCFCLPSLENVMCKCSLQKSRKCGGSFLSVQLGWSLLLHKVKFLAHFTTTTFYFHASLEDRKFTNKSQIVPSNYPD